MTAEELMMHYKKVREDENIDGGLGLITNPQAQIGGILLVGMNPSGEGDKTHLYRYCDGDFWIPKHEMMGSTATCLVGLYPKSGNLGLLIFKQ